MHRSRRQPCFPAAWPPVTGDLRDGLPTAAAAACTALDLDLTCGSRRISLVLRLCIHLFISISTCGHGSYRLSGLHHQSGSVLKAACWPDRRSLRTVLYRPLTSPPCTRSRDLRRSGGIQLPRCAPVAMGRRQRRLRGGVALVPDTPGDNASSDLARIHNLGRSSSGGDGGVGTSPAVAEARGQVLGDVLSARGRALPVSSTHPSAGACGLTCRSARHRASGSSPPRRAGRAGRPDVVVMPVTTSTTAATSAGRRHIRCGAGRRRAQIR
jgi:hypothetical protein